MRLLLVHYQSTRGHTEQSCDHFKTKNRLTFSFSANSQLLRLCSAAHKRNYVLPKLIVRVGSNTYTFILYRFVCAAKHGVIVNPSHFVHLSKRIAVANIPKDISAIMIDTATKSLIKKLTPYQGPKRTITKGMAQSTITSVIFT